MIKYILITYDVNMQQPEVKNALKAIGYSDKKYGHSSAINFRLPQNTLWKEAEELSTTTVLNEVNAVVERLNSERTTKGKIVLDKAIAVAFNHWSAIDSK